jgi:uncharacterized membrane protein
MSQSKKRSIQEAWVNTILGILISNLVLLAFGVPLAQAGIITAVMVFMSTVRSYFVRRFFNRLKN